MPPGFAYPDAVVPTALTIAGLDPSGGAGIAADLRSFQAAGVWGSAVCAVLTVQSTRGTRAVRAVPSALVLDQAREVLADGKVRAFKTGALGSAANVRAVATLLAAHPAVPSVVDPVMLPSRGGSGVRLHGRGLGPLRALAAVATVVTPNLLEAGALLDAIVDDEAAPEAARALVAAGARAALVKGGHGRGDEAVDWLALRGGRLVRIARPRRAGPGVHGTGCTLASLIAGRLAGRRLSVVRADDLVEAARWARTVLDRALAAPLAVGGGLRVIDVRWGRPLAGGRRSRD
jgi:hydroxymethylpyrimidine/phosphomethylpyrimidine kinase